MPLASFPYPLKGQWHFETSKVLQGCLSPAALLLLGRWFHYRPHDLHQEVIGFLAVKVLNNFNRPMTRLFYKPPPPFGPQRKDCGWGPPVVGPEGGTPAPTLSRRFRGSGSQRVLLSTVMNANGGADAGHKRRLENRLMVRRRDPYGSRRRGSGVRRTFESMLRSRINIAARPLGIAAISRP